MVEVLGAVASATQLAVMTMSLLEVVRKIKGGSKTLKRYQQQLLEVQALSESISKNPLLQTPDVDFHTRSILSNISQTNLEHRLRRGWFSRTCTFIYRDQDLVDFFLVLDRQKSSLSLVIENIQSRTLHQIRADLQTMSGARIYHDTPPPSDDESSCRALRVPTETSAKTHTMASSSSSSTSNAETYIPEESSKAHADDTTQLLEPFFDPNNQTFQDVAAAWHFWKTLPPNFHGAHYIKNEAGDNVDQHIGAVADWSVIKDLKPDRIINRHPDMYSFNSKTGRGEQVIGSRVNFDDDDEEVKDESQVNFNYDAAYFQNTTSNRKAEHGFQESATRQIIGPTFVRKPKPGKRSDPKSARSVVMPAKQEDTLPRRPKGHRGE